MEKLTDNEIIESFTKTFEQYKEKEDCRTTVYKEILDLINRQKAEIERLEKRISCIKDIHKRNDVHLHTRLVETAKSEAYMEFALNLKCGVPQETGVIRCADVDNTLKELTEKNDFKE